MPIELFYRSKAPLKPLSIEQGMKSLLSYTGKSKAYLEISLVGETKIRSLNARWRGKDKITDVLSFGHETKPVATGVPWIFGEIVIATPVAKRQALRAKRSLSTQVLRLAIHGFVHLEGLDHEKGPKQKLAFEARERKYLNYLKKKGLIKWDGSLQF